jgi:hypothetical protein
MREPTMADDETTRFERGRAAPTGDPYPTSELPEQSAPEHRAPDYRAPEHDTGTGWPGPVDEEADDHSGADLAGAAGTPPQGPIVIRTGGGFLRGLFFLTATMAVVVAIVLGMTAIGILPHLRNPFGSRTTDRSQPALLKSIQDMSRFVAAQGNFQVIVDVQNDKKYIPDFLVNDRTLFVAAGSVETYVDFAAIGQGAITESADHRTVTIKLPAPQLNKPSLDHDKSYVFAQQKGVLNHLGDVFASDPNRLQQLYQLGEQKITDAARDSGLQ